MSQKKKKKDPALSFWSFHIHKRIKVSTAFEKETFLQTTQTHSSKQSTNKWHKLLENPPQKKKKIIIIPVPFMLLYVPY